MVTNYHLLFQDGTDQWFKAKPGELLTEVKDDYGNPLVNKCFSFLEFQDIHGNWQYLKGNHLDWMHYHLGESAKGLKERIGKMKKDDIREQITRISTERDQLDVKIGKLENFIKHKVFADELDVDMKTLLVQQLEAMIAYKTSLDSRIHLLNGDYRLD